MKTKSVPAADSRWPEPETFKTEIRVLKVSHPDYPWMEWFTPVLEKEGKVYRVCGHAFGFDGGDEHAMEWGMAEWGHLLD